MITASHFSAGFLKEIITAQFDVLSLISGRLQWKKMGNSEEEMFYQLDYDCNYTYVDYLDETLLSYQNMHSVEALVIAFVHIIICILGFVGNSLVIVTYAFYKSTKSMTDVYLLNVAIADLLFVVSLPLIVYNELSPWLMGPVACKLLRSSYSVNLYTCMLLLACISADHYIAIVQTRRSFRMRSLVYSRLICIVVWASALLLSVPTFYFYSWCQPSYSMDPFIEEEEIDQTSGPTQYICEFRFTDETTVLNTKMVVSSTQLAVGFFLPLLVMVCCYTAVIVTLRKARNFQQHKAMRVVLAVVAVFIVCHLPYNVTLLYDTANMFELQSCQESDILQAAKTVTKTIAYLHCCLNPVLYAFVGVKFRNHFRRIFQDLWCLGKSYSALPLGERIQQQNGSSFIM